MFNWRNETFYLKRYIGSGALNTVVGWTTIFLLMNVGVSPLLANLCGYLVGLLLGFLVTRVFVFHSDGRLLDEGKRYIIVFIVSFLLNLLILQISLSILDFGDNLSQGMAAISYTVAMYFLSRYFVFRNNRKIV